MTDTRSEHTKPREHVADTPEQRVELAVAALLDGWKDMDATKIAERIDADQVLGALPLDKREKILTAVLAFQRKREGKPAEPEQQETQPRLGLGSMVRSKETGQEGIIFDVDVKWEFYDVAFPSDNFMCKKEEFVVTSEGFHPNDPVRVKEGIVPRYGWNKLHNTSEVGVFKGVAKWEGKYVLKVDFSSLKDWWFAVPGELEHAKES